MPSATSPSDLPMRRKNTLSHLNFSCRRGQTTAIIGGTGSGKSTVASLILRFYDVIGGSILLNGKDIRQMTPAYPARSPGLCAAESLAVLRHHCQQPALWQRGRHRRAADARRRRRPGRRFYPFAAGRLKFLCGTGRHQLFRRLEAAVFPLPALWSKSRSCTSSMTASPLWTFKTDAALRKALAKETQDAAVLIIAQRVSTI